MGVGDLRELDRHLCRWLRTVREVDDLALAVDAVGIAVDNAAVVRRDSLLLQQLEIERTHRTEARAFVWDGVGHLPPVEDGVGVGENEPPRTEFGGGRLAVDAELLDARHGRIADCRPYESFSSASPVTDLFLVGTANPQ